jgi:hypothetical protein
METPEKIISLIRMRGPVVPSDIAKFIGTNLLFSSAILSELVSKNQLKISTLKIGGSPLYYAPGQEFKLQQFADKLNEKDKKAFDMLREKKILRDSEQEPLIRVALRAIKDFAVPLQVNLSQVEIFWKWYLLTNEEAEKLIREELNIPDEIPKKEAVEEKHAPEEKRPEYKEEKKEPLKAEKEKKEENAKQEPAGQKKFIDKGDSFYAQIKRYFDKNKIAIVQEELKKKKSDYEFVIELETNVGPVEFYCQAKNKKAVTDQDLAMAYVQGQAKKLPVLFLTTGQPTKKAKEMLAKEFKGLKIRNI